MECLFHVSTISNTKTIEKISKNRCTAIKKTSLEKDLKQTNIEFDLLYDSLGWICFQKYINSLKNKDYTFFYIHQGGLLGNISMLERYEYKYKSKNNRIDLYL